MEVIAHSDNVHEIRFKRNNVQIAQLSDIHWDNPKCDRDLLKKNARLL